MAVSVGATGILSVHSKTKSLGKAPSKTGAVLSSAVIVCTKSVVFPAQSVNVKVLVTIYGLPKHPIPPLFISATVTVTPPEQLSASSVIAVTSANGIAVMHWSVKSAGVVPVGAMLSSIV